MIKRLLIVVLMLLPLAAWADPVDRDILLTQDGTVYTIESASAQDVPSLFTPSQRILMMTVQKGTTTTTIAVPASLNGGWHANPALAYDSDSNTIFIFWEAARNNGLASDLLVCSYQNGKWGFATALDSIDWDLRENLHIAITKKTEQMAADGTKTSIPEVTVHAVWWQQSGHGEWARYAMLTMDKGNVSSIQIQNLSDFLARAENPAANPTDNEILRHPVILESAAHDSVDVVFGDVAANTMHRLTLKPVANGRLRIPIGVREGSVHAPIANVVSSTNVSAFASNDSLAFYFTTGQAMNYLLYKDGEWSPMRSIALNDKITRDTAVEALRRMASSQ